MALCDASGMGSSDVAAVRAEAVDGKAVAYERTVARTASWGRRVGGSLGLAGEVGWKRVGWDLSAEQVLLAGVIGV